MVTTEVLGLLYMILMVAAFTVLAAGLDTGKKSMTTAGIVLVAIWGVCAVVH